MKDDEFFRMMDEIRVREELNPKFKIPGFLELIQITINRNKWHLRTPFQKWCYLYGIGRVCLIPVGFTLYKEDQTIQLRSMFLVVCLAAYLLLSVYTTLYYTIHGAFSRGLLCTCLLGVGLSLMPLAGTMLTEMRKPMQFLVSYGGRFIYPDDVKDNRYNRLCSDQIDTTIRAFFTRIAIINVFFISTQIGPAYEYISNGIRTTLTALKFPFIPENSDAEFIANLIFQALALLAAGLSYVALEIAMQLANDLASIAPKLVHHELEKFHDMIVDRELTKADLIPAFRRIVERSLNSDNIINCGSHVLYYRMLITPIAFTYSIAMSIFCQYALNYSAGYGIGMLSWVQLFYICELSQDIEDNGSIEQEILLDFEWYKMPVEFQKDFILLINRKQNGATFTVGPFGTINRVLFSDISKKVYTLVMFLVNLHSN